MFKEYGGDQHLPWRIMVATLSRDPYSVITNNELTLDFLSSSQGIIFKS